MRFSWPFSSSWLSKVFRSSLLTHAGTFWDLTLLSYSSNQAGYFRSGMLVKPENSISDLRLVIHLGRWWDEEPCLIVFVDIKESECRDACFSFTFPICKSSTHRVLDAELFEDLFGPSAGLGRDQTLELALFPSLELSNRERKADVRVTGREPSTGSSSRSSVVMLRWSDSLRFEAVGSFRKSNSWSVRLSFSTVNQTREH